MVHMKKLLSPKELIHSFPLERKDLSFIEESRKTIQKILSNEENRKLLIVGPCSIHDESSTLEYANHFIALSQKVKNFFLVLRFFIEKPRTSVGWTGFLADPMLDGSYQMEKGLFLSRKLLHTLVQKKIPCGMEFLHPNFAPYFSDLISWGVIGSRTSSSQIHRQLASSLPFAVGFKNSHLEAVEVTLHSLLAARARHVFPIIDEEGKIALCHSQGNPYAHIVLRGNSKGPNCDEHTIDSLLQKLSPLSLLIDCSHGNSSKNLEKQKECFRHVVLTEKKEVRGFMLESHLFSGNQNPTNSLQYGLSITDPCLGWEETEELILSADTAIARSPLPA